MATMNIQRNAHVLAEDGEVGRVRHVIVDPDTREVRDLVVEHDGSEWLVPVSDTLSVEGDRVTIAGERSAFYNRPLFDRGAYHPVDGEDVRNETEGRAVHGGAPLRDARDDAVDVGGLPAAAGERQPSQRVDGDAPYHLQLREERLRVDTEQISVGAVRVSRRLVERMHTVNVPIREERVTIEVLPGGDGRVQFGDRTLAEGETVEITVMTERVLVNKEVVVEDVIVRKEVVERIEQIQEIVRREELVVEDEAGLVIQNGGSTSAAVSDEWQGAPPSAVEETVRIPRPASG